MLKKLKIKLGLCVKLFYGRMYGLKMSFGKMKTKQGLREPAN